MDDSINDFGRKKHGVVENIYQTFTTPGTAQIEEIKAVIADYGLNVVNFR